MTNANALPKDTPISPATTARRVDMNPLAKHRGMQRKADRRA